MATMACARAASCRMHVLYAPPDNECTAVAQLHVVGENLDNNLTTKNANGEILCGIGMRLQQEARFGIYVASLTPNGPAETSQMIRAGDKLIRIDGYEITAHDTLEIIRHLVLGPPRSEVTLILSRMLKSPAGRAHSADQGDTFYSVTLRRVPEAAQITEYLHHDLERLIREVLVENRDLQNQLREALVARDHGSMVDPDLILQKKKSMVAARKAVPEPTPFDILYESPESPKRPVGRTQPRRLIHRWCVHYCLGHAMEIWKLNAAEQKRWLHAAHKAILRWTYQAVRGKLMTWRQHGKEQIRLRSICDKVLSRWGNQFLTAALNCWRSRSEEALRTKAICGRVVARWMNNTLCSAFYMWVEWVKESGRLRSCVAKVVLRMLNRGLALAFETWRQHGKEQIRLRSICDKVLSRWGNQFLTAALNCWRSRSEEALRTKAICGRVVARWMNNTLCSAFYMWVEWVKESGRLRSCVAKVVLRWRIMTLSVSFSTWQQYAEAVQREGRLLVQIASRMQNMILFKAWSRLGDYAYMNRRSNALIMKLLSRSRRCTLAQALARWRDFVSEGLASCKRNKERQTRMCTVQRIVTRLSSSELSAALGAWYENAQVSKNVHRNRKDNSDNGLLDRVLDRVPRLSRSQSWCGGLTEFGSSKLMHYLHIRWLKLVEEYYSMVEDSIFSEERALTWAEFEKKTKQHADAPFLLVNHHAFAADFDHYNESFEKSRDSYHRFADL